MPGGLRRDAAPALPAQEPLARHPGREFRAGAPVSAIRFVRGAMAAALGDGTVRFWSGSDPEPRSIHVHRGAILAAAGAAEDDAILTGGDDGRVCRVDRAGAQVVAETGGKWVDAVAGAPFGALAFASGKLATVIRTDGARREIALPSTVGGLAFAPKGRSLAVAHYGGVTLADVRPKPSPDRLLAWAGSHIAVRFSPNGRFVVSAMNENALHGWRLDDGADMRMSGYSAKPRSLSWSATGAWLATSGADQVVLWPFKGAQGPMGSGAATLAAADALVTTVACHPVGDAVAAGYADGAIAFARREDGAVVAVRAADGDRVADMAFDAQGRFFGYGTENGVLGLVDLAVPGA